MISNMDRVTMSRLAACRKAVSDATRSLAGDATGPQRAAVAAPSTMIAWPLT